MSEVREEIKPPRTKGAQTLRGQRRQILILKVAAELFAGRGYDSVSIDDIGNAAGVTGPAVYRYFGGKEALLVSIYEHLYLRNGDAVDALLAEGHPPKDTLERLVDHQIAMALAEPEKIRIASADERHLPLADGERIRAEGRRTLRIWVDIYREVRKDLTPDEAEILIHGVLAMINSITLRHKPDPVTAKMVRILKSAAMAMLQSSSA